MSLASPSLVDRARPLTLVVACALHAAMAMAMPGVRRAIGIERAVEPSFVEMTPIEEEAPEPVEQPAIEPALRPRIARTEVAPVERPPAAPTPEPAAQAAPVEAAAPSVITTDAPSGFAVESGAGGNGRSSTSTVVEAPAAQPAPTIDVRGLVRGYGATLNAAIGRLPRPRGLTEEIDATVVVGLTIDGAGRVVSVRIVRSSGVPLLDEHAEDFFRHLSQVPPPPPELSVREYRYPWHVVTRR